MLARHNNWTLPGYQTYGQFSGTGCLEDKVAESICSQSGGLSTSLKARYGCVFNEADDRSFIHKLVHKVQLSGTNCIACGKSILLQTEGTWCARCKAPYHTTCISTGAVCPQCRQVIDPPEAYFAYSQLCPECLRPNDPPRSTCEDCGAVTRWDTKSEYDGFRQEVSAASKRHLVYGILKLILAGLCGGIVLFFIWFGLWVGFFMFGMTCCLMGK